MILGRAALPILLASAAASPPPAAPPLRQDAAVEVERQALVERYLAELESFRAGYGQSRAGLLAAAEALARDFGREDALDVARYYAGLEREARVLGLELERAFDALRERAVALDESGASRVDPGLLEALGALYERAEEADDVTPGAQIAALVARLETRRLERRELPIADEEAALARGRAAAVDARGRFASASQRTPQLEPLWLLARLALIERRLHEAERRFVELDRLASAVGRPLWRERALLGLVGIARDRGDPFAARRALDALAAIRSPGTCWALARELAIQRLSEDAPDRALDLLESFPPDADDPEIDLELAIEEWRALVVAAEIRAGDLDAAAEALGAPPVRESPAVLEARALAEATLLLDRGEPQQALERVDAFVERSDASALGHVEALALRGRALVALDRLGDAVAPLEEAFERANRRDRELRSRSMDGLGGASAVGEWLGLSAVETLAATYVALGDPLRAAATIEAAHAGSSIDEARERLVALAARESLGAVSWIVGADRTLSVHVRADGTASAATTPIGRKDAALGIERLREALLETRVASEADGSGALRAEIARAFLPTTLLDDLARSVKQRGDLARSSKQRGRAPGLALLPHGVLERLPFEALTVEDGGRALGMDVAVAVLDRLRSEEDLAPPIDGRRARWVALGAPVTDDLEALPAARSELRSLDVLHPRIETFAGEAFTAKRLLDALGGDRSVHVATHVVPTGAATSIAPLALAASDGETVTADQIARRSPRLPLLVLAACGSADGVTVDGLGARGIAHAALEGGTRAAVVTLWPIEDGTGRTASVAFHAALLEGARPAEALRRARDVLRRAGAPPA
ncbi:MAG: CHAT domain-containing protein, partial [Planctomycetota bacterium]